MKIYYIHDNGGRPFKVDIDGNDVKIYKETTGKINEYSTKPVLVTKAAKIFIGKSPKNKMTTLSAGYGKKFDGNSILLHIKNNEYVFIGTQHIPFSIVKRNTKIRISCR